MTIRFEVAGDSMSEFGQNLGQALTLFLPLLRAAQAPKADPAPQAETQVEPPKEGETIEPPKAEKPRRKKDAETKADEPKPPTLEDARARLLLLGDKKGHEACFDVLKAFGVRKISEVASDKLADVIAKIDDAIGGES